MLGAVPMVLDICISVLGGEAEAAELLPPSH